MAKLVADFKDVESGGGGGARVPEGDYRVRITECKVDTAKSSGNTMLVWEYEIREGKFKGKKLSRDYTAITPQALWKLKGLLEALGISVPQGKVDLTPVIRKVRGKEFGVTVTDEEYEANGKTRVTSKVSDYLDLDTLDSTGDEDEDEDELDDEEEEEPVAKKKKAKKAKKVKKEVDEDEDEDDEIEDLDLDDI